MDLAEILIKRALFPGKSSGVKAAIWNDEASLTTEVAQVSEYTPTMEELSGGLLFVDIHGDYVPLTLDGAGPVKLEESEEQPGLVQIMAYYSHIDDPNEWWPLFMVIPPEYGGGIWRVPESVTDYTDEPMILVW